RNMRNLKTKFLCVLAFTLSLPLTASAADQKHIGDYLFNCNVSFNATGKSAYFLLGYTHLKGTGTLSCYSFAKDQTENIPLEVVVKGPGVGMGVTGFNVSGGAMGVGINDSPDA